VDFAEAFAISYQGCDFVVQKNLKKEVKHAETDV